MKSKLFLNLDEMARGADWFAEARVGVYSFVNKRKRDINGAKQGTQERSDTSKPRGRPQITCSVCGKGHLTSIYDKIPDRKQVYSAEIGANVSGMKGSNYEYSDNEEGTEDKSAEIE